MNLDFPTTALRIGQCLDAEVLGDEKASVLELAALSEAGPGKLSFLSQAKFGHHLNAVQNAVVLVRREDVRTELPITFLVVDDPKAAFASVAAAVSQRKTGFGISELASIHPSAQIAVGAEIGPYAVIREGARVGQDTVIYPFAYVGANVEIGRSCEIFPHSVLLDRVQLGDFVKVFSGAIIGSDGFGYFEAKGMSGYVEMPQVGTVVLEDHVRIGAGSTVDRATLGETRIGQGTKLDDFVHIGHNCKIGKNNLMVAGVAIGGSCTVGDDVILGGQVGVADHVEIETGVRVGSQSGISVPLKKGTTYWGTPVVAMPDALKMVKYSRKLPEIWERLKRLESKLGEGD